jgi:hypothetical protein
MQQRIPPNTVKGTDMRIGVIAGTAALAAGIAAATALSGAGTANADAETCRPGKVCLWENAFFNADNGGFGFFYDNGNSTNNPSVEPWIDNKATSLWNRTKYAICFYAGQDYSGDKLRVPAGTKTYNLGAAWNDRISSHKRC